MSEVTCVNRHIRIGVSDDIDHFEWDELNSRSVVLCGGQDICIDTYTTSQTEDFDVIEVFKKPLFSHIYDGAGQHKGYIFEHVVVNPDDETEDENGICTRIEKVHANYYRLIYSSASLCQFEEGQDKEYVKLLNNILQELSPNAYGGFDDSVDSSLLKLYMTQAIFDDNPEEQFLDGAYDGWDGEMHESSASELGNLVLENKKLKKLQKGGYEIACWSESKDCGKADTVQLKNADGTWNINTFTDCMSGDFFEDRFSKDHLFAHYLNSLD